MRMTDRIVDISDTASFLKVRNRQLIISVPGRKEITTPLEETSVLLLSNPAASLTLPVLSTLASLGKITVVCNKNYLPVGMMLPLEGHHSQIPRFSLQVSVNLPVKKRLWQQIVQSKIKFQSEMLKKLYKKTFGIDQMIKRVKSGDKSNVEAQAAQKYWKRVFGDAEFRRKRDAEDQNRLLNYGYTILRAAAARSICAAGLHPSFGLHHHNQYDNFCLASDLMEPFRPKIDYVTAKIVKKKGKTVELDKNIKAKLAGVLETRVRINKEKLTLTEALFRLSSSMVEVFQKKRDRVILPERLFL